jgi:hypothetical protein
MQFASSVSASRGSGSSLPRVLIAVTVSVLLLAGSVPGAFASDTNGKGPDITTLNLDQYGADIADAGEAAEFQAREVRLVAGGPDITTLNLDQYGSDVAVVEGNAGFQMLGEPSIITSIGQYMAGPHNVAGGDEGRSAATLLIADPNAAIFHLCAVDVTLRLTSECQ